MRIALLSDIHGNDIALKAVLEDIENNGGVDTYWILGDLVAIGHAPIKVLECLQALPSTKIIHGNTDRYVYSGARPSPSFDEVMVNPSLLPQLVEVEADFSWTQGAVAISGWLDWLSDLPLEFRTSLPDGTNVLCIHASPNTDDGPGIKESMGKHEITSLLSNCHEQLICVGHTHMPFSIRVDGKHIVNPGSVSNHVGADVRACYAIIDTDEEGYKAELFRVDYNQQAVIDFLERIKHPAAQFIIKHLRGERL